MTLMDQWKLSLKKIVGTTYKLFRHLTQVFIDNVYLKITKSGFPFLTYSDPNTQSLAKNI